MEAEKENAILVVEDDPEIAELLKDNISSLGYQVDVTADGEVGLQLALEHEYALLVLDLGLPRLDGLQLCRKVREEKKAVPVLMLTARGSELDRVLGLEVGATDYLVKPFSVRELLARIQAMLRLVDAIREQEISDTLNQDVIIEGDLRFDPINKIVSINGEELDLTARQFELLHLLISHPGRPFSRSELLQKVWGYDCEEYEGTVVSTVYRLRQKIEPDLSKPQYIQTRRGLGYLFISQTEIEE